MRGGGKGTDVECCDGLGITPVSEKGFDVGDVNGCADAVPRTSPYQYPSRIPSK